MERVIVERTFAEPMAFGDDPESEKRIASCLKAHNVRLVRSYVSPDGKRMICLFEAPDAESVRVANRNAGIPLDCAWTASVHEAES